MNEPSGALTPARLLVLTGFFSVYWGGTAVSTLVLLLTLLIVVTFGRMLGLLYIRWSAYAFGFTVIECYSKREIRGVLRILASMPAVMVEVNGAQYLWGARVDGDKEFRRWLVAVEKGTYDDEATLSSTAIPHGTVKSETQQRESSSTSVNELRKSADEEEAVSQTSGVSAAISKHDPADQGGLRPAPPLRSATLGSAGPAAYQTHHEPTRTWPLNDSHAESETYIRRF